MIYLKNTPKKPPFNIGKVFNLDGIRESLQLQLTMSSLNGYTVANNTDYTKIF
jgi:hypothetical protein